MQTSAGKTMTDACRGMPVRWEKVVRRHHGSRCKCVKSAAVLLWWRDYGAGPQASVLHFQKEPAAERCRMITLTSKRHKMTTEKLKVAERKQATTERTPNVSLSLTVFVLVGVPLSQTALVLCVYEFITWIWHVYAKWHTVSQYSSENLSRHLFCIIMSSRKTLILQWTCCSAVSAPHFFSRCRATHNWAHKNGQTSKNNDDDKVKHP